MRLPSCLLLLLPLVSAAAADLVYLGTYTNTGASKGIYAFRFDPASGKLDPLGLAAETSSPSFVVASASGRFLYAVNEYPPAGQEGVYTASAFAIDSATGKLQFLNKVSTRGREPCHLALDHTGRWLAVTNYASGSVALMPVGPDGRLGEVAAFDQHHGSSVTLPRQAGPLAHCVLFSPDNRFLLVADLGLDQILVYRFDTATGSLTPADPPYAKVTPGSGPRHMAFHPQGAVLYVLNEMVSTVTAFHYAPATGALAEFQTLSALPSGFGGRSAAAEIAVDPAGQFLYSTNRGHDSLAIFSIDQASRALSPPAHVLTGGKAPRHFALDPSGRYLFAANQATDNLVIFKVNAKTGTLSPSGPPIGVPAPVCVVFIPQ